MTKRLKQGGHAGLSRRARFCNTLFFGLECLVAVLVRPTTSTACQGVVETPVSGAGVASSLSSGLGYSQLLSCGGILVHGALPSRLSLLSLCLGCPRSCGVMNTRCPHPPPAGRWEPAQQYQHQQQYQRQHQQHQQRRGGCADHGETPSEIDSRGLNQCLLVRTT